VDRSGQYHLCKSLPFSFLMAPHHHLPNPLCIPADTLSARSHVESTVLEYCSSSRWVSCILFIFLRYFTRDWFPFLLQLTPIRIQEQDPHKASIRKALLGMLRSSVYYLLSVTGEGKKEKEAKRGPKGLLGFTNGKRWDSRERGRR